MIDWKLFRQYLKIIRLNKGLSQKELAIQLGQHHERICQYETKTNGNAYLNSLYDYCQSLGVNFEDLAFLCKIEATEEEEKLKKKLRKYYKLDYSYDIFNLNWIKLIGSIKKKRIEKKLSIEDFAKEIGISRQYSTQVERRHLPLSIYTLQKVCKLLDIDIHRLIQNG